MSDQVDPLGPVECGKDAASHYAFDSGWRNLNHGSFGTYPIVIRPVLRQYQELAESRVDQFILYDYPRLLDESRRAIANFVNAPPDTCVFVPNASTASNTVLRNLVFRDGDVIIYFATTYGACAKTIVYISETTPAEAHKIEYTYPVSDDWLCSALETAIADLRAAGKNPAICIFDTIVSIPGVRVPFERLTALCRQHGVLSCIDGAHGIGHIPLDLTALDPDFFLSNCHKWLDVPRGCALFYVPLRNQHLMRSTLPTSHGFEPLPTIAADDEEQQRPPPANPIPGTGQTPFIANFTYCGTIDSSPYLCIPAALAWRARLRWRDLRGDAAHRAYCGHLARRGGAIVAAALGTELLSNAGDPAPGAPDTLGACNMTNVRLPLDLAALTAGGDAGRVAAVKLWMQTALVREFDTHVFVMPYAGAFWVRLSAQVYLTEEDFEWAGRTLKGLCDRVRAGEWEKGLGP